MKLARIFGILLILFSVIVNFSPSITGFSISNISFSTFLENFHFYSLITLFAGVGMVALSKDASTGGLEKALDKDVVGVITFVRHGEKDKDGNLTEVGRKQARALGANFKTIYDAKNEGNLYLATSSSPTTRVYETVKEIMGVESKYNKPIMEDKRLAVDKEGEWVEPYEKMVEEKGEEIANNWYINSKYSEEVAGDLTNFLRSNKDKLQTVNRLGKKFHYIAGTHAGIPESFMSRVMVLNGKTGFNDLADIGGTLGFVEPVNLLFKKDGTYQINFRDKVYDVDMEAMNKLVKNK